MIKLVVSGDSESGLTPSFVERDSIDGLISVKHSISLSALRDGATDHELDVEVDDILG